MSLSGRTLWASSVGLAVALAPVVAPAAPDGSRATIAVEPIQVDGLSEEATAKIEEQLVAGLERGGADIVPPSATVAGEATFPCGDDADCRVQVAEANSATHVLEVRITKSGRDYSLEMVLSSGTNGSAQAQSSQDCEICGLKEFGDLVADSAASLQPKLEAVQGLLVVDTKPPGATVKVDGRVIGVTPISEPLSPGTHEVVLSKDGFHERERKVTLVAGGEEKVDVELQALPKTEEEQLPDGRGMRAAGWAMLGVGVGALGGGVTMLVLDERDIASRCTEDNIDVNGVCRFQYNTLGGGIGLAAAGGALLVGAAALLAIGYKRKKAAAGGTSTKGREKAFVVPAGLGIAGRF